MTYYIGNFDASTLLGEGNPRYFYAIRKTEAGDLYFARVDQLKDNEEITINDLGTAADNYNSFEVGVDFFEGRNVFHELIFENLKYEQYRWDDRSLYYYLDADGQLVVRINQKYDYPAGI